MTLSEVKALNRFSFDDGLTKEQFELRAGNTEQLHTDVLQYQ